MVSTEIPVEENKETARRAVLQASEAAEEFRQEFKAFLSQVLRPDSWRDGLKLVVDSGMGLLKDLQELLTQRSWSPDKLVACLDRDLEMLVQKHPELGTEWENVKVSFRFAKMKTEEALAKLDHAQVMKGVWNGVKEEIKLDIAGFLGKKHS